eukprot:4782851-Amphidinium_carterae.1
MIGHYTQFVEAKANKLGCAVVRCLSDLSPYGNGGVYLVCKYTESGNVHVEGEQVAPYVVGAKCAACPNNCVNGLCTCPGLLESCTDALGSSLGTSYNYQTCDELMTADPSDGGLTCAYLQTSQYSYACPLYCGDCTPPTGLGMSFCGQSQYIASNTCTGEPGTTTESSGTTQTTGFASGDEGTIGSGNRSATISLFFMLLLVLAMPSGITCQS